MASRFTDTEKYKDNWFIDLRPSAKLLFYFLIDNVNGAGFWEESMRSIEFFLGLNEKQYLASKTGLSKGLILSDDGSILYLKNFIRHQKNLPLNKYNNAHKSILELLKNNVSKFQDNINYFNSIPCVHVLKNRGEIIEIKEENLGAYQGLISPTGKGNSNSKGNSKNKEGKHLFKNSPYFDVDKLIAEIGIKYQKYDINYYWEAARIYSESKGMMYKNWKATIQGFIRRDESDGKAKFKKQSLKEI